MSSSSSHSEPFGVLIVGGGVAGLEAGLALRDLAGDRVSLRLLAPGPEFVYRPMSVQEPFSFGGAQRYPLPEIAEDLGAELISDSIASVDTDQRIVHTASGAELGYDALMRAGSYAAAKEQGLMRLEGKDYIMQEGDVVNFRFNV